MTGSWRTSGDVPGKGIPSLFDVREPLRILARELDKSVDVGVDGVLDEICINIQAQRMASRGSRIIIMDWAVFLLFLVDQGVVGVEDPGLVGFALFGSGVDGAGGCEGAVGDDFAEAYYGLVIFGGGLLVPHSDNHFLGSEDDLLGEWPDVASVGLVVGE